ncbi:TlpA family protein disulfide reductase [uncultured Muribaculum sp.]|uniref:TlpA family protein disulfide reductase n=1 Tax=uncultured Muribaculum sp. TaxID=1918613 RepID=UPI0025B14063|nr:TlpA family protein disulfide reductase [uncultured Muribaculum sp.]
MPHYAGYDYAIMFDWNRYKPSVRTNEMRRYVELFNEAKKGKLTDAGIEEAGKMSDTFYADALLKRQNAATEDLAKMKNSIQKTPDVANNELFDAITAPHKGKVVVVDLWNTWCGPCRASIKRNEPLKDGELSDEDIVWIYIADESSDTNQYLNLIPDIKGLHYMVSGEQINAIRNRFKVDGIPYYVLVDRKGNAVGHPDFRDPSKFIKGIKTALADK